MEPFIGQIQPFGFNFAPRGWAKCDGSLLAISSHTALFSLLGTIYGGDGRTTFALPDLRGRTALHQGTGPGLTPRPIGQRAGTEWTQLSVMNLPSHNHTASGKIQASFTPPTGGGTSTNPNGANLSSDGQNIYTGNANNVEMANNLDITINNTGGGQEFSNIQPYLVVNWCIALVGVYPSRN